VTGLIEKTLAFVEKQAPFQNIRIVKELNPAIPPVFIDADQIQQVFVNIILNAADAMAEKGGTLTIKADVRDGFVEVSFADTGHGIPKEHLSKLFDPFFTTKQTGKGTGLGLAISYGIIQSHSGDIRVESEVGKGATFRVKLPINADKREKTEGTAVVS
jgi:two-component system NtrC family sensor kinase